MLAQTGRQFPKGLSIRRRLPLAGALLLLLLAVSCADEGEQVDESTQVLSTSPAASTQADAPAPSATVPFWNGDCSAPPPGYQIAYYEPPYEGCYLDDIPSNCGPVVISGREYCAPDGALYTTSCGTSEVDFDCPASLKVGESVVAWRNVPGSPSVLKVWSVLTADEAAFADLHRAFFEDQETTADAVIRSDGLSACVDEGAIIKCAEGE